MKITREEYIQALYIVRKYNIQEKEFIDLKEIEKDISILNYTLSDFVKDCNKEMSVRLNNALEKLIVSNNIYIENFKDCPLIFFEPKNILQVWGTGKVCMDEFVKLKNQIINGIFESSGIQGFFDEKKK